MLGASTSGNVAGVTVAKVTGGAEGQNVVVPVEERDRLILVDQGDDLENGRGLGLGSGGIRKATGRADVNLSWTGYDSKGTFRE